VSWRRCTAPLRGESRAFARRFGEAPPVFRARPPVGYSPLALRPRDQISE